MRALKENDYKLFEQLVSSTQPQLFKLMLGYLKKKYTNVIYTKDYIVAVGEIPIALVAHLDTVFKFPVEDLYYDREKGIMWSPDGLGADDRAGVYAIIQIIRAGYRPSIILTTDEEKGGLGAAALAEEECPIPDLKYMIQLDRRGTNDCVFYDCYNPIFIEYVESFGFIEHYGSYSDISFLMPEWKRCGVNLSVGYMNEHSACETLHVPSLCATINKVKLMLSEESIPDFEYKEFFQGYKFLKNDPLGFYSQQNDNKVFTCCSCKQGFSEYELFPVKGANGETKFYCSDCVVDSVDWCNICGEPYEIVNPGRKNLCEDCAGGVLNV